MISTPETIASLREKAIVNWRTWARQMNDTGKLPQVRDLADAASLLGKTVDDLESDAAYIREHDAIVAQGAFWQSKLDEIEKERGPIDDVRKMIEQTEEQLRDLRDLERAGHSEAWQVGEARGTASRFRRKRPDLFE
jgi:hypothetical protein